MQNIINFLKYHNLVPIILGVVLLATASAFANEDVRNAVIGEEIITEQGTDNGQLLAADLDNFDFQMTIANVSEDEQNYYVDYSFYTLGIKSGIWQPLTRQSQMTISKSALGGQDLGLYVTEEIGEVADYELNYLKKVQTAEREKGMTKLVASIDYTGLIGLILDVKEKILPGYEPVITEEICDSLDNDRDGLTDEDLGQITCGTGACRVTIEMCTGGVVQNCTPKTPTEEICDSLDNNCNGEVDEGGICETMVPEEEIVPEEIVPEEIVPEEIAPEEIVRPETFIDSHPEAVTVSSEAIFTFHSSVENATFQCKVNSLDWADCSSPKTYPGLVLGDYTFQVLATDLQGKYDETPATFSWTIVGAEQPPAEDVCDAAHLNLCTTQTECETVAGFWYNDTCSTEAEVPAEPEEPVCDSEHLDLCTTQELCEGTGLYWHNETCNLEPETPACQPIEEVCDGIDNDCDGLIDEENVCQTEEVEPVCDTTYLDLCTTQELCEGASLHWYNDVCNLEPVPEPEDTTAPVITLSGEATVEVEQGAEYVDAGAMAEDDVDGDITSSIVVVNPVDIAAAGTYTITYNVADAAGNQAAEVTRSVNVTAPSDTTAPVITLLGTATVDIDQGATYIDAGATAADDVDGDITSSIVVVNPVDTSTVGTYTVNYNVSDAAGNAATEVTRTVNVIEPAPAP